MEFAVESYCTGTSDVVEAEDFDQAVRKVLPTHVDCYRVSDPRDCDVIVMEIDDYMSERFYQVFA